METTETIQTKDTCAEGFCPHVDPKKHFALIASIVFVGIVIGIAVTAVLPPPFGNYQKGYDAGHKAGDQFGFDRARKLVEDSPIGKAIKTPDDVRSLTGTVVSINGNRFVIHTQASQDPFEDKTLSDRTVILGPKTEIVNVTLKPQKIYQEEMEKFLKSKQNGESLPDINFESNGTSTDIMVNSLVTVESSDNLVKLKEFVASKIKVSNPAVK